jgi:CHAT domain-containing protein/Tfp pilus assembly protein PilF
MRLRLIAVFLSLAGALAAEGHPGVVVESLTRDKAAMPVGLSEGDILLKWSRGDAGGEIQSPFDLMYLEIEQSPRGAVKLSGQRLGQGQDWVIGPDEWGLETRPILPQALLRLYNEGRSLEKNGSFVQAAGRWRTAAAQAGGLDAAWLLFRAAGLLAKNRRWSQVDECYRAAIGKGESDGPAAGPDIVARLLRSWGATFEQRNDWASAEDRYQRAITEEQKSKTENLFVADAFHRLGIVSSDKGDLERAEKLVSAGLAIRERLAPESLPVAASYNTLGNLADDRGDEVKAQEYLEHALGIRERLAPGSLAVAASYNNLGYIALNRGDLLEAEDYHRRSLLIKERLAPGSLDVAASLGNLGNVAAERGDLAKADEYYDRARTIEETLNPGGLNAAGLCDDLGLNAASRGDLVKAEEYYRRALAIQQRLAPGSLTVAVSYNNLAEIARERRDFANAELNLRRALRIQETVAPDGLDVAVSLSTLGQVSRDRGDFAKADEEMRQALAIEEKVSPDSEYAAEALHTLAEVAHRRGNLESAEQYCRRALGIREKLGSDTRDRAESLAELAGILRDQGHTTTAASLFVQALDILERQVRHLGGTDKIRSGFRSKYAGYYRDAIDLQLREGNTALAFHVSERSRARSLLELLAERDLVFADLPSDTRIARQRNAAAYDHIQAQIVSLSVSKDQAKLKELQKHLQELERERDEIAERVRRASPVLATLQYPQPLNLQATRQALDPGTALLSYVVAESRTLLFVLRPVGEEPGISVFTVDVPEKTLRSQVRDLRASIQRAGAGEGRDLAARLARLYALLIGPAETVIATSSRLLIIPDGPLSLLPFAALRRSSSQYLVEWKPLHTTISATVYAELKGRRRDQAATQIELAAFGDPVYPGQGTAEGNSDIRFASTRGLTLSRLLFSSAEVESISSLFAARARVYLRADATEERAKSLGKNVRYIHFATHGFVDERFPLNSGVALTIPARPEKGRENGLLQAWEVLEQVRIDADLVTLSGCNTALGQEVAGEGLIGLTRAFQYAGARSVLASLWSIDDRRTSLLMQRFYAGLRKGKTKDEALRAAQISLLREPNTAPPVYWAAFVLNGDWR